MIKLRTLSGVLSLLLTASSLASVDEIQQQLTGAYASSAAVQQHIEQLDDQARADYYDYLHALQRAEQLEAYNDQLKSLIQAQRGELSSLQQQLWSLQETEQSALPLLNNMRLTLGQFVEKDLPFLPQERAERLERLGGLLTRADVAIAEKYRQVLEAYQIEVDYGRTLEAYRGTLVSEQQPPREVTFLRLGRVALYYQTPDGQESGQWHADSQSWKVLDGAMNWSIQKGIQLALQQTVPELLALPIRP